MSDDPADLSKLHDIVTPPDVSWWPLAPGWIGLMILAGAALIYGIWRSISTWRKNAYRREALEQLTSADSADEVALILKRTALAIAPREEVVNLDGSDWINWLGEKSDARPSESIKEALTQSIYDPTATSDLDELKAFASHWIHSHRPAC